MKNQNKGFSLSWHTAYNRIRVWPIMVQSTLLLLGIPTGHRKVFAIGFNKTATTSIHKVFQKLGMVSVHNTHWRNTKRTYVFLKYQCFTDGAPDDFTVLDRRFKNSKFILNTRDLDEWIDSRLEHIKLGEAGKTTTATPTWDCTDAAVKHWIVARNSFHQEVLDYFRDRPEDLLVLNYIREPDPGSKIAGFLGKKRSVTKEYERSTKKTREAGSLRNEAQIHRCLRELGVPKSKWKTDIHGPIEAGSTTIWPYDTSGLTYPNILTPPDLHGDP